MIESQAIISLPFYRKVHVPVKMSLDKNVTFLPYSVFVRFQDCLPFRKQNTADTHSAERKKTYQKGMEIVAVLCYTVINLS